MIYRTAIAAGMAALALAACGGSQEAKPKGWDRARAQDRAARAIFSGAGAYVLHESGYVLIPDCPEDAVIIGRGDFSGGRWTRYECGPARDSYREEIGR